MGLQPISRMRWFGAFLSMYCMRYGGIGRYPSLPKQMSVVLVRQARVFVKS